MTASCHTASFAEELSAVARTAHGTTSLIVLRKIEQTVDSLTAARNAMAGVSETLAIVCARIKSEKPKTGMFLDAQDQVICELEEVYETAEAEIPKLLVKKNSIDMDAQLSLDQRELLHSAFHDMIDAMANLVEATKDLRAAVIGHDLAAEPRETAEYSNSKALIKSLHEDV